MHAVMTSGGKAQSKERAVDEAVDEAAGGAAGQGLSTEGRAETAIEQDGKGEPCAESKSPAYATLADVARGLDDTKLCQYLDHGMQEAFMELSCALEPNGFFPRIYFECFDWDEVWFLEFFPGQRRANYGVLCLELPRMPNVPRDESSTQAETDTHDTHDAVCANLLAAAPESDGWVVQPMSPGPTPERRAQLEQMCGGKEGLDNVRLIAALQHLHRY